MKNTSIKNILSISIFIALVFGFQQVNAAISTKLRICAVKGTVQTWNATDVNGGNSSANICPLKRTLNQTECRLVNRETMVETGSDGWAIVEYPGGSKVKIMPNTQVKLSRYNIFVNNGSSWFKVEKISNGEFVVKTPTAIAGIRGTEFIVNVEKDGSTSIQLIEGSIEVSDLNQQSNMMLAAGMEVTIPASSSTLNTGLLNIQQNDEWWTDWPTLVPISEMPGYNGAVITSSNNGNIISPTGDSHVYAYNYSGWNTANWGKYEQLGAGWIPAGGEKRAYLKFDLTGIDPTSVNKATLKLYHNHTGGDNSVELGVYRLLNSWNEGRGTYNPASNALPGELSWVNQPTIDQYPVVYFNPGPGINKWIEVDITSLVKAWLVGVPNYGMAIKAGENYISASESQYGFCSREYADLAKRPQLTINGGNSNSNTINNSANLLVNGRFEDPVIGAYKSFGVGQDIAGWKVIKASVDLTGSYFQSSEGKQSIDLHGTGGFGGIQQSFATVPQQKYNVVFDFAGNAAGGPTVKEMRVSAAGHSQVFKFDCTGKSVRNMGWTTQSWEFTANQRNTTLVFETLSSSGIDRYGPTIDNVKVYSSSIQSFGMNQNTSIPEIVGDWKWFTDVIVTIHSDGKVTGSNNGAGTWKTDKSGSPYQYLINWSNGQYVDHLNLIGQTLKGVNQNGTTVSGVKIKSNNFNQDLNLTVSGQWNANQNNGYKGILNLQQDQSGRITGNAIWNGYLKGIINGQVLGNAVEFTITYPNGDIGTYKGTLTQNGMKIIEGSAAGNNGVSAKWDASK